MHLRLTLVDTPGFGDSIDNRDCWKPIQEYLDKQFDDCISRESKVYRPAQELDRRVHACIYFIEPTGEY